MSVSIDGIGPLYGTDGDGRFRCISSMLWIQLWRPWGNGEGSGEEEEENEEKR